MCHGLHKNIMHLTVFNIDNNNNSNKCFFSIKSAYQGTCDTED